MPANYSVTYVESFDPAYRGGRRVIRMALTVGGHRFLGDPEIDEAHAMQNVAAVARLIGAAMGEKA